VELAILKGDVFTSGAILSFGDYDLTDEHTLVDVSITKVVDQVEVRVNGNLEFSFPTDANVSNVLISSENSISRFTKIAVDTRNSARLFATRQFLSQPDFSVKQSSPDRSILEIRNSDSDYAVVTQYLDVPSRKIETQVENEPLQANLFFNGWIVNTKNAEQQTNTLVIGIDNSQLALGFQIFSMTFTSSILLIATVFLSTKRKARVLNLLNRLRNSIDLRRLKKHA
jgi:endoglucanase Acf2